MADKFVPLSVPNLKGNEMKYVQNALETEWVSTGGAYVDDFENKLAEYVNMPGAVCCQSGTAGLHIALLLNHVERDDLVIAPTLTFIAAVNPIKYIGADPVFMDCDDSLTIDPEKLKRFCEEECTYSGSALVHNESGRRVRAIVVVHVFGNLADMEAIMSIADAYSLKVVEDATEALGSFYTDGKYKGRHAGTIGNTGVYSFNGNKIVTTGGGGMIVSNDTEQLKRAKHLTTQAKSDTLYYTHDEIGYNYRMTNVQAAIGLAQIEQLEAFIAVKEKNYLAYVEQLKSVKGVHLIPFREGTRPNYWFYGMYIEDAFPLSRDEMIQKLSGYGIQTRPIWGLIHMQLPYEGAITYEIEHAQRYLAHVLNIPCSTNLQSEDVNYVADCIRMLGE